MKKLSIEKIECGGPTNYLVRLGEVIVAKAYSWNGTVCIVKGFEYLTYSIIDLLRNTESNIEWAAIPNN